MHRYFRIDDADADPAAILVPGNQVCAPWGGGRSGPCDKCEGRGETDHDCLSCIVAGVEPDCPACRGRVRWRATCPVCRGSGEIDARVRRGVSVFPRVEGLLRYMLDRDTDFEGKVVVELEGLHSDDTDFDADEGALLVVPTRVAGTRPIDAELLARVERSPAQR
jgi:hypothetical protein